MEQSDQPDAIVNLPPEHPDESADETVITEAESNQEEDYRIQLYRAAISGNWEAANKIFSDNGNRYDQIISTYGDTALHIAAAGGRYNFVKELLQKLCPTPESTEQLELKNKFDNTAFCLAAASGVLDIVKEMKEKNQGLPNIPGSNGMKPILMAALRGHAKIVDYLWGCYNFNTSEGIDLLVSAINTDLYKLALDILKEDETLAFAKNGDGDTPLHVLARKTRRMRAGRLNSWRPLHNIVTNYQWEEQQEDRAKRELVECLWKNIIKKDSHKLILEIVFRPAPGLLFAAIKLGNYEFVSILLRHYPDLIWEADGDGRTIFHAAVEYRQEKIYSHIYEIDGINHLIATRVTETHGYNILHLAAILPSPQRLNVVSGPALQMQRELLWFQEVEGFIQRDFADKKNTKDPEGKGRETPRVMFTREHGSLRKEGEKWMRDTSKSCMIVATLVATVVFQAICQPPSKDYVKLYWTFVISVAFSLVASTASILTFLAILTSRYAEEDFLVSLPLKLMGGILLLSLSLMTMLSAFTATIAINFAQPWLPVTIAVLAVITGGFYIFQHFPLLFEAYRCTFRSNYLFRPQQQLFRD